MVIVDRDGLAVLEAVPAAPAEGAASSSTCTSRGRTRSCSGFRSTTCASSSDGSSPASTPARRTSSCRCPTAVAPRPSATPRRAGIPYQMGLLRIALRRPHLHRAIAADPRLRREAQAVARAERDREQARRDRRRLARPRHDRQEDRPDDSRGGGQGDPHADQRARPRPGAASTGSTRPRPRS